MIRTGLLPVVAVAALAPSLVLADDINPKDLLNLSLEQLSNVEVTSVSKTAEKQSEAAAAIYVITQEDIKNSAATTIPDLLRGVPGIVVTQSGSHDWTVSTRGFDNQFSNKLLVLIDGRTIYSPLFSGVIWDAQDVVLADIDRIEVIRGPGATLWGANAVNGVINIITKNAKDTQGGLAEAEAGNQIKGIGDVREGVKIGDDSYARVYAKFSDYDSEEHPGGTTAGDSWQRRQGGFRSDSTLTSDDKLTLQGDVYRNDENAQYIFPDLTSGTGFNTATNENVSGGNVLGRWVENQSKESQTSLQVYFDNAYRSTAFFNDNTNTVDTDFQHTWTGWNRQEIVWGTGYRFIHDANDPSQQFSLSPDSRNDNLFNAFLQDKFTLDPKDLFLTLGSKIEHNDYSGIEVEPSARLSWLPADNQTVWGSVSRAVHTPNRFLSDGMLSSSIIPTGAPPFFAGLPILVSNAGNKDLDSEELIAYELGYRIQPTKTTSLDLSTFYNDYTKLFASAFGTPYLAPAGTYLILPITAQNTNSAHSTGFEVSAKWDVMPKWQLSASYSYVDLIFDHKGDPAFSFANNSKNQFSISSVSLLPYDLHMTNALYYVSDLNAIQVPGYYRFDTKFTYPLTDSIDISLVGQNLLNAEHKEFAPFFYQTQTEIGRSIYGGVSWRF